MRLPSIGKSIALVSDQQITRTESIEMAKSAQQRIPNANREGSPHEVLEGIRLVGEEAPSSAVDSLWRRAWGEEQRQVQARTKTTSILRAYVGGLKKVLG